MKTQVAILTLLIAGTAMAQNDAGTRPQPPQGGDFIKQFDKDGDGKVSQAEFNGPAGPFAHMDKNNDGFISEDEAPKGPPSGKGKGGGERP